MPLKYYLPENDETPEDARDLKLRFDWQKAHTDPRWFAQQAAEIYHGQSGWDRSWPVDLSVVCEDGTVRHFTIEREMVPEFSAYEKKPTT